MLQLPQIYLFRDADEGESMVFESISQILPAPCRAVVVNVSTKEVTTLAILSILRYSELPVLIVDLQSTDGSVEHFNELFGANARVDLHRAKLAKHGLVLDKIFREIGDENILLVDSDLEIVDGQIVTELIEEMSQTSTFGAGAIHGPGLLTPQQGMPPETCLYRERMWVPFTMIQVAAVRTALKQGLSFINRWVPNEVVAIPLLSKALAARFFVPVVRNIKAEFLSKTRKQYGDFTPNLVCCDTGADVFCHLKYDEKLRFADLGLDRLGALTRHYHGITRKKLNKSDKNATQIDTVLAEVLGRLDTEYGYRFPLKALSSS